MKVITEEHLTDTTQDSKFVRAQLKIDFIRLFSMTLIAKSKTIQSLQVEDLTCSRWISTLLIQSRSLESSLTLLKQSQLLLGKESLILKESSTILEPTLSHLKYSSLNLLKFSLASVNWNPKESRMISGCGSTREGFTQMVNEWMPLSPSQQGLEIWSVLRYMTEN